MTFSANANNAFALLSGSDVTDIGVAQLSCANAREQSCKNDRQITFRPISLTR
jgi:hypothetical protein